jgi:hypothetical protein
MRLHFLFDSGTQTPYIGPTPDLPYAGFVRFEHAQRFPTIKSLFELFGFVTQAEVLGHEIDLTDKEPGVFDQRVAERLINIFYPEAI